MPHLPSVINSMTLAAILVSAAGAVRAESITVESIISEAAARQRAMERVPEGAEVTATRCQQIGLAGGGFRYRCSVHFRMQQVQQGQP